MQNVYRRYILARRPSGQVQADDFSLVNEPMPVPGPREVLVRVKHVSVDPYMRNRMNNVKSYVPPYWIGETFGGDGTGEVVASASGRYRVGDLVMGPFGWQEYALVKDNSLTRIDPGLGPETAWLGILGLTGLTAYFGLLEIGKPETGEQVVVSGAAGAVGSVAGQIARIKGCRVTGITGSAAKAAQLRELGFDEVVNYRETPQVRKPLMKTCPEGIDVYFDNVGGEISDGVMYLINDRARIVLCGQVALYNEGRIPTGPRLLPQLIIHRARMEGFIVFDYYRKYSQARQELAGWMKDGKLSYTETITEGFDRIPEAFLGLFRGDNTGKQLVRIS